MGTQFKDGQKPKNNITVSKSGATPARLINPDTGVSDRSFAQPNPVTPPAEITPKAHGSAQEEVEALNRNSTRGKTYDKKKDGQNEDDTTTAE